MNIKFEKIGENENNLLQNRELLKDQMVTPKSKRIFGLKPESNHEFDQKINKIISTSTAISNYLQDSIEPVDDNGNKIINYSEDKKWFFDHITFIFSTGLLFDEVDQKNMDYVLQSFENSPNKSYFLNNYYVLSYDNSLIQSIENYSRISSGNYHILMSLINSANDEELLDSPSEMFNKRGIVYVATGWDNLNRTISNLISNYGFIAEYFDKLNINFDNANRLTRKNCFDTQPAESPMGILNSTIVEKFEDNPEKRFQFEESQIKRSSQSLAGSQRGINYDSCYDKRIAKNSSLYNRIYNSPKKDLPSEAYGGMLRQSEMYLPEDEQEPEFIMYNDLNTYDKSSGKNIYPLVNPEKMSEIPNFSATSAEISKVMNNSRKIDSQKFRGIFPK